MSPEQHLGDGYSYEADLWSFGVLLYELLVGSLPFGISYEDEQDAAVLHKIKVNRMNMYSKSQFRKFGIEYTSELEDLLENLLKVNKSERLTDIG